MACSKDGWGSCKYCEQDAKELYQCLYCGAIACEDCFKDDECPKCKKKQYIKRRTLIYLILADLILFIHVGWVLFTIFGSLLAYKRLWLKCIHIAMLIYGLFIEICGWVCPLTYLEDWLRTQYNPSISFHGDFISYYLGKLIYLDISKMWLIIGAIAVVGFNLWFYYKHRNYKYTR